jgi:hypothetical protein
MRYTHEQLSLRTRYIIETYQTYWIINNYAIIINNKTKIVNMFISLQKLYKTGGGGRSDASKEENNKQTKNN